jgi:hypothetical protein
MNLQSIVVVHRWHSYHASSTIENIPQNARIVNLGSCGWFNNVTEVLEKAPTAVITSTKWEGTMQINDWLYKLINETMLAWNGINWSDLWKKARESYWKDKRFESYIPPHENIWVMLTQAYNQMVLKKSE